MSLKDKELQKLYQLYDVVIDTYLDKKIPKTEYLRYCEELYKKLELINSGNVLK